MDNTGIDGRHLRRKTGRVALLTSADRTRVGQALQALREAHRPKLDQADIAKKIHVSTATVQAAEYNKYKVKVDTLEKYAAIFGTTVDQLQQPDVLIPPTDLKRFADLNLEHLSIARGYMRATRGVRAAIEYLVEPNNPTITEDVAELIDAIKGIATKNPHIAYWTTLVLEHSDLMADLADRLSDPVFEDALRDLIHPPKGKK
jgi:transcriptional regulator with XRE-family HTH domain